MPSLFDRWRRTVDASGLPGIVTPTDDATPLPSPSDLLISDDELIASLRCELGAANRLVAQLQEQLLAAQTAPVTDRHCANCPGLEQTIELLQDERRDLRKQLAGYQLAATRGQRLRAPDPAP